MDASPTPDARVDEVRNLVSRIDAAVLLKAQLLCHLNGKPELAAKMDEVGPDLDGDGPDSASNVPNDPFNAAFSPKLDRLSIFHRPSLGIMTIAQPPLALPDNFFASFAQKIRQIIEEAIASPTPLGPSLALWGSGHHLSGTFRRVTTTLAFDDRLTNWITEFEQEARLLDVEHDKYSGIEDCKEAPSDEESESEDDVTPDLPPYPGPQSLVNQRETSSNNIRLAWTEIQRLWSSLGVDPNPDPKTMSGTVEEGRFDASVGEETETHNA